MRARLCFVHSNWLKPDDTCYIATVPGGDEALFAQLSPAEREALQTKLAELYRHKINLANEVLVLNVGGYVGPSTAAERDYAERRDKRIRYLEPA